MKPIRVLQTSDWHIGRFPFGLRSDRGIQRQDFLLHLLEQLPMYAKTQNVDVVLLPGDLLNSDSMPNTLVERMIGVFREFSPIPVIISCGNHDPYDDFQMMIKRLTLKRPDLLSSPHSIYIAGKEWQRFQFNGFAVTARSFVSNKEAGTLQQIPPRGLENVELLCFHGSVGEVPNGQEAYATISPEELIGMNYDYSSIGHYHSRKLFFKNDKVVAGYAGAFLAQRKSDTGEMGFLLLDVEPRGVLLHNLRAENWDKLQIHDITLTFPSDGDPVAALERKWREYNIQLTDYVRVTYTGRVSLQHFQLPNPDQYRDKCFYLENIVHVSPDWDYESLAKGISAEAQFIRIQLQRIQDAIQRGNQEDELKLRDILEVGLQAFRYQRVEERLPQHY